MQQKYVAASAFLLLVLLFCTAYGALTSFPEFAPAMQWNRVYGRVDSGYLPIMERASDGGYIVGAALDQGPECWVVKLDASGYVQWNRTYSGPFQCAAKHAQQTSDGGYIIAGWAYRYFNGSPGTYAWLMKTRDNGVPEWNRTYGVSPSYANWVEQTADGGYVLGGVLFAFIVPQVQNHIWLVKTDSNGLIQWNMTYGWAGITYGVARFVHQTNDGGYVAAGTLDLDSGSSQYFLLKTDSAGNMQWNHTYSQGWFSTESFAASTSEGGYIIAGMTSVSVGRDLALVVKTDGNGTLEWQRTYDAGWPDVKQTSDGGYVLLGGWWKPNSGPSYPLLLKTDRNGTVQWMKRNWENGAEGAYAFSVVQSTDGGYVVAAFSEVNIESDQYVADLWIAKLASEPTYQAASTFAFVFFVVASCLESVALVWLVHALASNAAHREGNLRNRGRTAVSLRKGGFIESVVDV